MSTTSIGPVELLVVKFPGNQFKGEIAPALKELVDSGTIRVLDMLFAIKDEEGEFAIVEVRELESRELEVYEPLIGEGSDLLSEGDVEEIAGMLEPNSSAAILLFENTWATRFRDSLSNANAELIFNVRIPQAVIQELTAERASTEA
jgi:hypothetical protein